MMTAPSTAELDFSAARRVPGTISYSKIRFPRGFFEVSGCQHRSDHTSIVDAEACAREVKRKIGRAP